MPDSTPRRAAAHSIVSPALKQFAVAALYVGTSGIGGHGSVHAQAELPATAPAAADRAKHDGEKVFELIRMHADRPRKAPAAVVVPAQAPAAVSEVEQPTRPTVVALIVTPRLQAIAARLSESSSASHGGLAPAVAFGAPAAPVHATELTLKQVSLPAMAMSSGGASVVASELTAPTMVLVSSVEPDSPRQLARRLGQGPVVVHFEVLPDRTVGGPNIDRSRHPGLNTAALVAEAAWRVKPISKATAGVTALRFE